MLQPARRWVLPAGTAVPHDLAAAGARWELARPVLEILVRRGCSTPADLDRFLGPAADALHDPRMLPDADIALRRLDDARRRGERILVVGDFDADGLSGLVLLARAVRLRGQDVWPYVPDRATDGHGLPARAVDRAVAQDCRVIVTVDCGTSSRVEIEMASRAGIDVLVTDHHAVPADPPAPFALINPRRSDSAYPERALTGSGVAFKVAQLILAAEPGGPEAALDLVDLAAIGTVSDVAPLVGENRALVRLGIDRIRREPRPGMAALLESAGVPADRVDVEAMAYSLVPRLNAAGRVGDASVAARLLDASDADVARALAAELGVLNNQRRDAVGQALGEAEAMLGAAETSDREPAVVVVGPWPIGVIGVVAGRLADARGVPAVVISTAVSPWRGSARGRGRPDLAAAFALCARHLVRHGGHPEAAGCDLEAASFHAFREDFLRIARDAQPVAGDPVISLDAVVPAAEIDYALYRQLARLAPFGPAHPEPLLGIEGAEVARVRAVSGGHTQLTIRKGLDVVDAVAFGRADLAEQVRAGDRVDLAVTLDSRTFGGYESLQLVVRDAAPHGLLAALAAGVLPEAGPAVQPGEPPVRAVGEYGAEAVG